MGIESCDLCSKSGIICKAFRNGSQVITNTGEVMAQIAEPIEDCAAYQGQIPPAEMARQVSANIKGTGALQDLQELG